MLIRFMLLPFLIFTSFAVSAALTTVPLREVWSLSVDDSVIVNQTAKTAVGRVMLPNAEGVLFRATATTTSARLLSVAEGAITGGRLNPYLTAALLAGGLSYEAYQWYESTDVKSIQAVGYCDGRTIWGEMTSSACAGRIQQYYDTEFFASYPYHVTTLTNTYELNSGKKYQFVFHHEYKNTPTGSLWTQNQNYYWNYTRDMEVTSKQKHEVDASVAENALLNALSSAPSSRAAFGENSQPYPLDGLFTNEDLAVDPTYSPSADLNAETLPDYITKYNNGLLQTTDPSKPNYVTPAQYEYIKSQANAQAAAAAGGSTSTNPFQGIEQPITQKQYDESNTKTDEAAANQINSTDWSGVDTASKGGDGANDALDKMAKGIDPTLPVLLLPDLPEYSACRTIDLSWNGHTAVFPSSSQCIKMEEFKTNLGYFLYLLTAVGIILELLRRVE